MLRAEIQRRLRIAQLTGVITFALMAISIIAQEVFKLGPWIWITGFIAFAIGIVNAIWLLTTWPQCPNCKQSLWILIFQTRSKPRFCPYCCHDLMGETEKSEVKTIDGNGQNQRS